MFDKIIQFFHSFSLSDNLVFICATICVMVLVIYNVSFTMYRQHNRARQVTNMLVGFAFVALVMVIPAEVIEDPPTWVTRLVPGNWTLRIVACFIYIVEVFFTDAAADCIKKITPKDVELATQKAEEGMTREEKKPKSNGIKLQHSQKNAHLYQGGHFFTFKI